MSSSISQRHGATEGNKTDDRFQADARLERDGKSVAIACLSAAIESFIAARDWSRAQLAEDICGIPEANFSKITNGHQGDFWGLVYKLPADVRADFYERLHESERVNPMAVAEQLIATAFQLLRVTGHGLPVHASHMAKVAIAERKKRTA